MSAFKSTESVYEGEFGQNSVNRTDINCGTLHLMIEILIIGIFYEGWKAIKH